MKGNARVCCCCGDTVAAAGERACAVCVRMCVHACVCVRARACVYIYMCVCVTFTCRIVNREVEGMAYMNSESKWR